MTDLPTVESWSDTGDAVVLILDGGAGTRMRATLPYHVDGGRHWHYVWFPSDTTIESEQPDGTWRDAGRFTYPQFRALCTWADAHVPVDLGLRVATFGPGERGGITLHVPGWATWWFVGPGASDPAQLTPADIERLVRWLKHAARGCAMTVADMTVADALEAATRWEREP